MTASTDALEQQLVRDLTSLGDRLADDRLCTDLYAAIAGHALHPRAGEGRLSDRAGEALDEIGWDVRPRTQDGQDPGHTDRPHEQHTRAPEGGEWEREAHAEADAELRRRGAG
jgi:hypothetical protein